MNIRELRKGKAAPKLPKTLREVRDLQPEDELQPEIVKELERRGFVVLEVNIKIGAEMAQAAREKGAKVGLISTPGVPDLFVSHFWYPTACWLGMEVKPPKGRVRPAQLALREQDRIIIVRSVADAVYAVDAFYHLYVKLEGSPDGIPAVIRQIQNNLPSFASGRLV